MRRAAIVNGDDFGLSPGVNKGVIEAYRRGILTSASLIAVGEAFEEAAMLAREHPGLSIGVHLVLVEGTPVLPPGEIPSLVTPDGRFLGSPGAFLARWLTGRIRLGEIRQEFEAQVAKVLDHGVQIDKLDSHMHLHLLPGIFETLLALAKRHRIRAIRLPREPVFNGGNPPGLRGLWRRGVLALLSSAQVKKLAASDLFFTDHFSGLAESGRVTEEDLFRILDNLKPGVTEIMVHPGYRDAVLEGWSRSCRYQREREIQALTSPRVRGLIEERGIMLITYREVCRHA